MYTANIGKTFLYIYCNLKYTNSKITYSKITQKYCWNKSFL